MSTELAALIERLETAAGPDRELDGDIALSFGWTYQKMKGDSKPYFREPGVTQYFMRSTPPLFTASIDAALPGEDITSVSEQKQQEGMPVIWVAVHRPPRPGAMSIAGRGYTEALARRVAALRARATAT